MFVSKGQGQLRGCTPAGREEESERDCLGAVDSMRLQMSRAEGRAEGSSCRHALIASSISAGHSSGTLHTQLPFRFARTSSAQKWCITL